MLQVRTAPAWWQHWEDTVSQPFNRVEWLLQKATGWRKGQAHEQRWKT